jgi:hypothetical protein
MHHLESHVLFVPSIRIGQIGQAIATISFPALEGERCSWVRGTTEIKTDSKISLVKNSTKFFLTKNLEYKKDCFSLE